MPVTIVRLGSARGRNEGLRIGTVRRPPRGVKKTDYARQNWYDVWLPNLSPTASLLRLATSAKDVKAWRAFERRFEAELRQPDAAHLLDLLAALSHHTNVSIGCYCEDESRCHRSILRRELQRRAASITGDQEKQTRQEARDQETRLLNAHKRTRRKRVS
jgi:uncharacterized protein YeaO (DUF488 family)